LNKFHENHLKFGVHLCCIYFLKQNLPPISSSLVRLTDWSCNIVNFQIIAPDPQLWNLPL
jgi:hypothetical protein